MLCLRMATGATNYINNLSVAKQIAKDGKLAPSKTNLFSLKSVRKNSVRGLVSTSNEGNKMKFKNRMLNDAEESN